MNVCMVASFSREGGIGIYSGRLCAAMNKHANVDMVDWSYSSKLCALFAPFRRWDELKRVVGRSDVVHVQYHLGEFMFFFLPLLYLLTFNKGCKVVVTAHEDGSDLPFFLRWYDLFWLNMADKVIVHTQEHLAKLLRTTRSRAVVIKMGCDVKTIPNNFCVRKHWLFLPGFINAWKGHDVALRALSIIKKSVGDDLKLVIAGNVVDKKYYAKIKELAKELGVDELVEWHTEFLPQEEYDYFMKACGIVLLPYKRITMSAVAGEVVGWNKHVCASDLEAFKEYFCGRSCHHVAGDAIGLAASVKSTWADWGVVCTDGLRSVYSWPNIASSTVESYQNI